MKLWLGLLFILALTSCVPGIENETLCLDEERCAEATYVKLPFFRRFAALPFVR